MNMTLDPVKVTEAAEKDGKSQKVKVIVWDALKTLIFTQIGKNKDTRFARECEEALPDNDAFFDLRFVNFKLEAVVNGSASGLIFTGRPRKEEPIIFKIPLPEQGRILTAEDYDHAQSHFAEVADAKPEDITEKLPPIVKRLNKALGELQSAFGFEFTPDQFTALLATPEAKEQPEPEQATQAA